MGQASIIIDTGIILLSTSDFLARIHLDYLQAQISMSTS